MCRPGAGFRFSPVIATVRKSVNLVRPRAGSDYLAPSTAAPAVVVYWPRVNLVYSRSLYFFPSIFIIIFYFSLYTLLLYLFTTVPFVSPLYFCSKGTTRSLRRARDANAYMYKICACTRWSAIFKGPRKPSAAKGTLIFRNYATGRELFSSGRRRRESRYKWTPWRWRRVHNNIQVAESRKLIHIILLPCMTDCRLTSVVKANTSAC